MNIFKFLLLVILGFISNRAFCQPPPPRLAAFQQPQPQPHPTPPPVDRSKPNGCGRSGSNIQFPDYKFTNECNNHDICYSTPGKPKAECDNQFRKATYAKCNNSSSNAVEKLACKVVAEGYSKAVEKFGDGAYEDAQRNATQQDVEIFDGNDGGIILH